jgi:hypothetical protein
MPDNIIIGSKLGDGNILIGTKCNIIPPTTTTTTTSTSTTTTTSTSTTTTTAAGNPIDILYCYGCDCSGIQCAHNEGVMTTMLYGGCYSPTYHWCILKQVQSVSPTTISVCILCNGFLKDSVVCTCQSCSCTWACSSGYLSSFCVNSSDVVKVCLEAEVNAGCACGNCVCVTLTSVAPQNGGYVVGTQNNLCTYTCGSFPTTTTTTGPPI